VNCNHANPRKVSCRILRLVIVQERVVVLRFAFVLLFDFCLRSSCSHNKYDTLSSEASMDINNSTLPLQQSREGEQDNTDATEPEDVDLNGLGNDVVPLAEEKNPEQTSAGSSIIPKKRLNRRALLLLGAFATAVIVTIVVLIPTVFLKSDDEPEWKSTGLDVFTESAHKIITSETHTSLGYGEHIAMSSDGTRLVLTSGFSEGNIEVWDFDENRQWIFKTRFFPPDLNYTNFQVEGLDMSEDGSRIIVSRLWDVRVFEDATGDGIEWSQVGETLDGFSISLWEGYGIHTPPEDYYEWPDVSFLGKAVAMSSNGNVIAITAPDTSTFVGQRNVFAAGAVKVFQHIDSVDSSGQEKTTNSTTNNKTWIPLGQVLFGEQYEGRIGQAVDISGDGHRLVVSSGEYRFLSVHVLDFDGEVWKENGWEGIHSGNPAAINAPGGTNEGRGQGLSLSKDGKVLVISYPNSDSRDGAYNAAGLVMIWRYDDDSNSFNPVQWIYGTRPFEMVGSAVALSDDNNVLAVASNNVVEVFELNELSGQWEKQSSVGEDLKRAWMDTSLAIDANGMFLAVGAPNEDRAPTKGHSNPIFVGRVDVYERQYYY
jgi:hypothetical protein